MKKLIYLLVAASAFTFQSCGDGTESAVENANEANEAKQDSDTTRATIAVSEDDSEFMTKTASSGLMEVELGKIAQQKATDSKVKQFAEMIVRDHTSANDELKALAARKNVTLPTTMGDDHQKHIADMNEKAGRDFDKAYMKMMVDHHQEDVDRFERAANNATDSDLKALAGKTLPVLRSHLEQAKSLNDAVKK